MTPAMLDEGAVPALVSGRDIDGLATTSGRISQYAAVRQCNADEQPAMLAIAQRIDDHEYLVAWLQAGGLPALTLQIIGTVQFDMPQLSGAVPLGHVKLDERMRVGPLKLHDRTGQWELPRLIEHREGMVGDCCARDEQQTDCAYARPSEVSNCSHTDLF